MTAYDVFKRALVILGYSSNSNCSQVEENLINRSIDIIGEICSDLSLYRVYSLEDTLDITEKQADALCYGTAMLIALTDGDSGKYNIFNELYHEKRLAILSCIDSVKDIIPSDDGGVST